MILILGGTVEGREFASELAKNNQSVILTVATEYGSEVVENKAELGSNLKVVVGRLNKEQLTQQIKEYQVKIVVDATHPHASIVTETAFAAASDVNVRFIRYERPNAEVASNEKVIWVNDFQEAADQAVQLGKVVFLATGSKNLDVFIKAGEDRGTRFIARVLPDPVVIKQCLDAGIRPAHLVAMQGPFSTALNIALLREYKAEVMVTKDSGGPGGFLDKLAACQEVGIPVVVVRRPNYPGVPVTFDKREIIRLCSNL